MGRAYTEEDWQNMTVAEKWNTDYSRMAYGWASEGEPRPAHLSDLGNSKMRELKKLQDEDSSFWSTAGTVASNMIYPPWSPTRYIAGKVSDAAGSAYDTASDAIGSASDVFSNAYDATKNSFNQHLRDKRFQQAALSGGGIRAYPPGAASGHAQYNHKAKLNALMADQNRMQQGQINPLPNQMTDVGIPGYKPKQYTPNTGKVFDSSLATADLTREDFNKLPNKRKSDLRGFMSDYMLKYHGLPSGGGDRQGGSVPVMPQQDPLGKLNKLMHGNIPDAKRPNIGPLNEQGEFQKSDEKETGAYSKWYDISPGAIWNDLKKDASKFQEIKKEVPWVNTTVNNLEKLIGFETQEERDELNKRVSELFTDKGGKELLQQMQDKPFTTATVAASAFLLFNPASTATRWLITKLLWGNKKKIILGASAWQAAKENGYPMDEYFQKAKDLISGEASWNSTWEDVTNPTEKETEANGNKSNVPNTSGKKVAVGKGSWVDRLHQPIRGGAGSWDTNFNRGMEMLEHAGTPLSKRGDHPSKGWRASDIAANKALADIAKARLAANSKSIFGKVGQSSIEDSIKDDVFKALGGDAFFRWDPSDEELEQTISEAAIAIQLLVDSGMDYSMARDKVINSIK